MLSDELSKQEQIDISQYIAGIYKQGSQKGISEFRHYCLDNLRAILRFDVAIWFDRRAHELAFTDLDTYLYKTPSNFLESYNKYVSQTIIYF